MESFTSIYFENEKLQKEYILIESTFDHKNIAPKDMCIFSWSLFN